MEIASSTHDSDDARAMKHPNRIRAFRRAKNLTQGELADIVRCEPNTISRLESGSRQLNDAWLDRLSVALGCEKWEIVGGAPTTAAMTPDEEELLRNYRLNSTESRAAITLMARQGAKAAATD